MEEIKVGEYVRTDTKIGRVLKIKDENKFYRYVVRFKKRTTNVNEDFIKKHSPYIIDLIEVGDIVEYDSNNYGTDLLEVVNETCTVKEDYDKGEGFVCTALDDYIRSKYIKSVITKEQIESIKYEV